MSVPQPGPPEEERPTPPAPPGPPGPPSPAEELECKICYQRYNAHGRRPKILACLHRVCARCLGKILGVADGSAAISCPFCRHETETSEYEVQGLPDDSNIMTRLAAANAVARDKSWTSVAAGDKEVVLTPRSLSSSSPSSRDSSNCLVITIMEVQGAGSGGSDPRRSSSPGRRSAGSDYYAEQRSPDSGSVASDDRDGTDRDADALSKLCAHVPRVLVWLLGFFYFGSLPLGIYLLVIQRVTLGVVCVSLVPSSLTVCLVYGFCQCLCQGVCDCSSRG